MSGKTEHTAGEWLYGVRRDGTIWLSIGDRTGTGAHFQGDLVASEADARLIVAAPRLLKELIELRQQINDFCVQYGEADFYTGDATSAIALATGALPMTTPTPPTVRAHPWATPEGWVADSAKCRWIPSGSRCVTPCGSPQCRAAEAPPVAVEATKAVAPTDAELDELARQWANGAPIVLCYDGDGRPIDGWKFSMPRFRSAVRAALNKEPK